jgi:predicted  nucleic acid-binding Zn-ribbon protein
MHGCRRGAVALVLALIAGLVAPSAAFAAPETTTTKPSKPTSKPGPTTPAKPTKPSTPGPTTTTIDPKSVPPPPAFGLPLDLGLKLLAQRDAANKDISSYSTALPADQTAETAAEARWKALQRKLDKLRARVRATQHDLDLAHEAIRAAAVEAYMNSGSSRLTAAISALATASSALEAGRSMHLIGSFGDEQNALVKEYVALEEKLKAEKEKVQERKDAADVMLADARAKVESDKTEIAHARVRLTTTVIGILAFEKAATSASSPILGPALLTAQQLADFVRARGYHPRITVPLDELAQDYITEGANAGVRGDVAFAQSILETGGFSFPGGGQVLINDNNFAGIGACDSCKHGFSFESAQIGVRAQMQALRIYVDPDLVETTLKQPLVMPKMLNLGFRGRVQTWWDLWGTWATGAFYGQRVYDIYTQIVEFAKTDPEHPPGTPPGTPMPPRKP